VSACAPVPPPQHNSMLAAAGSASAAATAARHQATCAWRGTNSSPTTAGAAAPSAHVAAAAAGSLAAAAAAGRQQEFALLQGSGAQLRPWGTQTCQAGSAASLSAGQLLQLLLEGPSAALNTTAGSSRGIYLPTDAPVLGLHRSDSRSSSTGSRHWQIACCCCVLQFLHCVRSVILALVAMQLPDSSRL
jgi:hypothetical protein